MIKFISAVLSAFSITLFEAGYNYNGALAGQEIVYSFGYQFTVGLIILLAVYIILFMPLSLFVDSFIARQVPQKGLKRNVATLIAYSAAPMVVVLLILLPSQHIQNVARMMVLFGAGGAIHALYQIFLGTLWRRLIYNSN